MPVWKIILSKVTTVQQRAQKLLDRWHDFRASGSCTDLWNIQEGKDYLESLATGLSTVLYCSPADSNLENSCDRFEKELDKFKERVYRDLLAGLKTK